MVSMKWVASATFLKKKNNIFLSVGLQVIPNKATESDKVANKKKIVNAKLESNL
jgi:hypothetical protein